MRSILLKLYNSFPFSLILKYRYENSIRKKVWNIFEQLDDKDAPLGIGKKDYILTEKGNKFIIDFNDMFGFDKSGYRPVISFEFKRKYWHTEVEGLNLISYHKVPLFELVCELRGYTLLDNINEGDIIIDAGCSDAFVTCYFGKKVGDNGLVIALEPDNELYDVAEKTLSINKLDKNVVLEKKAFFNKNTTLDFFMTSDGGSKISEQKNGTRQIETIDLKTIITKYKIPLNRLRLIKMDIEGAEMDVLEDLVEFVSKNENCVVAFASYHRVKNSFTWMEAEKIYADHPTVLLKTTYPIHITTFIINKKNIDIFNKLRTIPRIEEVYEKIRIK